MVTGLLAGVAPRPVTVKLADIWPVGTITCAGTLACWVLLLVRDTTRPPEPGGLSGAAALRLTVKPPRCMPTATVPLESPLMASCGPTWTETVAEVAPGADAVSVVVWSG